MASYPFVPSYHDYGPRGSREIAVRGITVHMAEGGGTVGYLSRQNPNSVSVHYVIEYTGRVVQMLLESHVNGTINPRDIRTTNDPAYTFNGERIVYGVTAAKKALGIWWDDPNRATIGIEIEGFAKDGPNAKQAAALVELVKDIRSRHPLAHNLGHRDFADYKACPGKRIDWKALGGHGAPSEDEVVGPDWYVLGSNPGTVTAKSGRGLVNLQTGEAVVPPDDRRTFQTSARGSLRFAFGTNDSGPVERRTGHLVNYGPKGEAVAHLLLDDVKEKFVPAVTPSPGPHTHSVVTTIDGVQVEPQGSVTLP